MHVVIDGAALLLFTLCTQEKYLSLASSYCVWEKELVCCVLFSMPEQASKLSIAPSN